MPPSRHIRLTEQEDARLREIEQDPYLKPKVRLRAQVLRLSDRGSNMEKIASYTGRSPASVARDFDRWTRRGLEGLADGRAPGNPPRITGEMEEYMEEKLSEERTWNATQLVEALEEQYGLVVTPEAVRQHLQSMGYSWKRTRYVPNKAPDPDAEREAKEELEALKRGR
jgi:transposase